MLDQANNTARLPRDSSVMMQQISTKFWWNYPQWWHQMQVHR